MLIMTQRLNQKMILFLRCTFQVKQQLLLPPELRRQQPREVKVRDLLCFGDEPEKTIPSGDRYSMRELVHFGYKTMEDEMHVVEGVWWVPRMLR